MRLGRVAILLFTFGAGVALSLGILGSCTVRDDANVIKLSPHSILITSYR